MSRVLVLLVATASAGCMYIEAAATYYPHVDGGDRVASTGYGFGVNLGFGLKYRGVHGSIGRGFEIAAADYQDATGRGKVGHVSPWTGRLDVRTKQLAGRLWTDLTVGGTWGKGAAAVEYEAGVVADMTENNPTTAASAWSLFAGPSLHFDNGVEYDYFWTIAPTVMHSTSGAFDPFTAYGVTARIAFQLGPDPPAMDWGGLGFVKLMRAGYDSEDARRRFDQDQRDFHRRQGELKEQERERQERERKDREDKCRREGNC